MGKVANANKAKPGGNALLSTLLSSRILQILLLVSAISCVLLFYSFATTKEDFFSKTKEMYKEENRKSDNSKPNVKVDRDYKGEETMQEKQQKAGKKQAEKHADEFNNHYHSLFIFTKVKDNPKLKDKFNIALSSLFEHAKFEPHETFHMHFICDEDGRSFVEEYLRNEVAHPKFTFKVHFHIASTVSKKVFPMVQAIQFMLGQKHPYYEDTIFFISLVLHKILPETVHRVVQLDLDLKFAVNIREIWKEFGFFTHDNIIGLAHENQPVYRHLLFKFRQDNPETKVGNPASKGNPGFNSGVILLHLDHMRSSYLYNSYLDVNKLQTLVQKYSFKGHLGDQDFYSLLSFDFPELFHTLDCVWNRQLCEWWRSKGYANIFDQYFHCSGDVKIWHGNCGTPIPA